MAASPPLRLEPNPLLYSLQLGLPVRVTRKQKSPAYPYGVCYIFDGLVSSECIRTHPSLCTTNLSIGQRFTQPAVFVKPLYLTFLSPQPRSTT